MYWIYWNGTGGPKKPRFLEGTRWNTHALCWMMRILFAIPLRIPRDSCKFLGIPGIPSSCYFVIFVRICVASKALSHRSDCLSFAIQAEGSGSLFANGSDSKNGEWIQDDTSGVNSQRPVDTTWYDITTHYYVVSIGDWWVLKLLNSIGRPGLQNTAVSQYTMAGVQLGAKAICSHCTFVVRLRADRRSQNSVYGCGWRHAWWKTPQHVHFELAAWQRKDSERSKCGEKVMVIALQSSHDLHGSSL